MIQHASQTLIGGRMGGSAADQMLMMEEHEQKMRQKAFRKAKESKEMAEKNAAAE